MLKPDRKILRNLSIFYSNRNICLFLLIFIINISCNPYPELKKELPSYRLFIIYVKYIEQILEKDFVRRNSANKKDDIDKAFAAEIKELRNHVKKMNAGILSLKEVIKDIPEDEKTIFFREYNRTKVQILMLAKHLKRENHKEFAPILKEIIPEKINEFDLGF